MQFRQEAHLGKHIGVPGKVGALPATANDKAQTFCSRPQRAACAVVVGRNGTHGHPTDHGAFPGSQLFHVGKSMLAQQCASTQRHQQPGRQPHLAQRRQIQVVVMQVGNQHRIDLFVPDCQQGGTAPAQMDDAITQHRVRQNPRAANLDQHRGVADIGDSVQTPVAHCFCRSRSTRFG